MDDLELAKKVLKENNLSLVIVKSGRVVYTTKDRGVKSFLEAIEEHGEELYDSAAADRVVGLAIAMLCEYAKIRKIYGEVMSVKGFEKLSEKGIVAQYGMLVPEILDRNRVEECPFEKIAAKCENGSECYEKIRALFFDTRS